jgi:hypothetical protein
MRILTRSLCLTLLAAGASLFAQDVVTQAWQMELKGDSAGARELLQRVLQTTPDNVAYLKAYAELLERHHSPQAIAAYEKLSEAQSKAGSSDVDKAFTTKRIRALKAIFGGPTPVNLSATSTPAAAKGIIYIPGPLRSFARMAALSPELNPEDVLPAMARNVVTNGYQASTSNEALDQTEYLKLVVRYLAQARELEKLGGADKTIKVEQCESAQTGELLKVIGYRMRGGCGTDLVLETVNASKAFLTIDSGFPLANLEQALRTNRPFIYEYKPTPVPVLYGADYWLATVKEKQGEFIDTFLAEPALCRMYLGLSKLDPATSEELRKVVAASRLKAYAHVLDFFGGMFQIRNGKAVVPGAPRSEKGWADMAGVSPEQGGQFFDRLISKDDGWLAAYFDALARIQGPSRDYLADPERMKRFYAAVRGKVTSPGPARPVFRANTDLMLLTTRLRIDPETKKVHIPGNVDVWKNLFVNHPQGKYDGKLTKSAAGWKDADDILEALFGLSRKAVENEPLKIFMAMTDINRHRAKPLEPATVDKLAREYRNFQSQFTLIAEANELSDATILKFIETAKAVGEIKDTQLKADAAGSLQSLIGLWQIFHRQGGVKDAEKVLASMLDSFSKIKSSRDIFDASRNGVTSLMEAANGNKNLGYQERMLDLLAGVTGNTEEAHTVLMQDMIRVFESQRLISLQTIFELDDNLQAVAKGGKLDVGLAKKLAARIAEVQLPKASLSSQEKNNLAFGYWTEKHIESQRKLNLANAIEKASNDAEKLKDLRGNLAGLLRDTLVGYLYAYYAPPAAQILQTNPVFVRSHDFIGLQGSNQTWKSTEVFGSGWPSSAGGRLVGSLSNLPYALAEAEQNFLIPTREQALIWGDLVPQMIVSATVPRWWNVTPGQMHWIGLHMSYGEIAVANAAFDGDRRAELLEVLDRQAPPYRVKKVEQHLAAGRVYEALEQIVPAELFVLAAELAKTDQIDPLAAAIRKAPGDLPDLNATAIGKAFGTPKPTLGNSYRPELLNLRSFPTLMGYSSRIMAETWESNLLYYAALADEVGMPPAQLNVAVKDWTRQTVERIFATHLEDWPALLRSLRSVGDEVRDRAKKNMPLTQRADGSFE